MEKYLKILDLPKKRDKTSCLLRNTQWLASFHIYIYIYRERERERSFGIIARHILKTFEFWTLCSCLCIFSLYISHLLLSSQSIHRYVNYFDIQVLMMVTETERLTSTLHQNIFTYLDYVFLLPSYIYIYV